MYTISPLDCKDTALDITLNTARISQSSQKLLFSWVSVLTGREDTTFWVHKVVVLFPHDCFEGFLLSPYVVLLLSYKH